MRTLSDKKGNPLLIGVISATLLLSGCSAADCDPNQQDEMFAQMACSVGGYQKRTKALTDERDVEKQAVDVQNTHLLTLKQELISVRQEINRLKNRLSRENLARNKLIQESNLLQRQYEDAQNNGDNNRADYLKGKITINRQNQNKANENIKMFNKDLIEKNRQEVDLTKSITDATNM